MWELWGSKFRPSHWLGTSLIQQLVATAQAVKSKRVPTKLQPMIVNLMLISHVHVADSLTLSKAFSKSTKHMYSGCLRNGAFFCEDSEAAKVIVRTALWSETRLFLSHLSHLWVWSCRGWPSVVSRLHEISEISFDSLLLVDVSGRCIIVIFETQKQKPLRDS